MECYSGSSSSPYTPLNIYFPTELISKYFAGREHDIAHLIKSIESNGGPIVAIYGRTGLGKTSLSLKVGLDLMQLGYSAAYCRFEDEQSILSALDTTTESMGLPYIQRHGELSQKLDLMYFLFQKVVNNMMI